MVAHVTSISSCNAAAASARRSAYSTSVAPRRPLPTRSTKTGTGKKSSRTGGRGVEVIKRKMEALRQLVPSGGDYDHRGDGTEEDDDQRLNDVDELLFRAADYIVRLQVQVKAMQLMVDVLEHTKDC